MRRYFARKLGTYVITFFVAVSIDWAIPRFMPGDPVQGLISRMHAQPGVGRRALRLLHGGIRPRRALWKQYLNSGSRSSTATRHEHLAVPATPSRV